MLIIDSIFFEYLPHHSDYEIVAAYKAFNGDMRDNIIRYMYRIGIMLSDI